MLDYRLTTEDNEYDPFTQFTNWYLRDIQLGHNTCARIARLSNNDDSLSDEEKDEDLDMVMNKMIDLFFLDNYIKVKKNK